MQLMVISENNNDPEIQEMIKILGTDKVSIYSTSDLDALEESQKYYNCLYTSCPENLLKFKVKIPY
jgi:hypothetical protein